MSKSMSIANQIHRMDLAIAGARSYAKELPKEVEKSVIDLERTLGHVRQLAVVQEKAKQALAIATSQLRQALDEGGRVNAGIVRMAEATWGPRHPRVREFRPMTEGRATKRAFKRRDQAPAPASRAATPA